MTADITPQLTPSQVAGRVAEIIRAHPGRHARQQWIPPGVAEVSGAALLASLDEPGRSGACCTAVWAVAVAAPGCVIIAGRPQEPPRARFPGGGDASVPEAAAQVLGLEAGVYERLTGMPYLFTPYPSRFTVLAELDRVAGGGDPRAR